MKTIVQKANRIAILSVGLFMFVSAGLNGQEPIRSQPVSLFDGTSLKNWTKRDGSANPGWVIDDEGSLFRSKRTGDLYYNIWFKDFELTFEWKLNKGGNSGVKYRVTDYGKQSLGCEFQVQDDSKINKHSAGGLYALYAPDFSERELKPVGQWNTAKIVVCGNKIEHWLNGKQTVSATVGSSGWLKRVAESKFKDKENFGQNEWGRIFLQDHGNPVWFKNITLTPLICNKPADGYGVVVENAPITSAAEPVQYFEPVTAPSRILFCFPQRIRQRFGALTR